MIGSLIKRVRAGAAKTILWCLSRQPVANGLNHRIQAIQPIPYLLPPGFGRPLRHGASADRGDEQDAVFVTSRFRSGSTLLWRCFRECQGTTCYYEPLNPRRWFDHSARGNRVDPSHRGVSDYWKEYASLEPMTVPWDPRWCTDDIYLPPTAPMIGLHRYLDLLIRNAAKRPVLQFNRIDFRLHWLRSRYPQAKFVHLLRNPRDQWISTFLRGAPVAKTILLQDFHEADEFYLTGWANDLKRYLPVFAEAGSMHPYDVSYLIWRLSNHYAQSFCDHSVGYEAFVRRPREALGVMGEVVNLPGLPCIGIVDSIDPRSVDRWKAYDDGSWFRARERFVDKLLLQSMDIPTSLEDLGVPEHCLDMATR